jgi:uncharacterized membrane protein
VQIGALVGTIMVANVFVIIIPNQKKTVAALIAGQKPIPAGADRQDTLRPQQPSHLPVIFPMISNHYPLLFATIQLAHCRHRAGDRAGHPPLFHLRHQGLGSPWWTWGVSRGMIAIAGFSWPARHTGRAATPPFSEVASVIQPAAAVPCAATRPIGTAPNGVLLDSETNIRKHARQIDINAVRSHAMPPGNISAMTTAERQVLAAWIGSQ